METRLTRCYAIWIRTKEEGQPSFLVEKKAIKHDGGIFLDLYSMKIKEQTRKLAAGCIGVGQGEADVV